MQESQNTTIVQDAYAAFLRGDVAAVLAVVDDAVTWQGVTGAHADVPMAGVRHGRDEVARFFQQVADHITFSRFEPQSYVAQGDRVVALGHYTGRTSAGGDFDSDFAMIFTLRNGRIVEFQEFLDVAQFNAAWAVAAVR
jgi:ketosteroid isomerase-like protein